MAHAPQHIWFTSAGSESRPATKSTIRGYCSLLSSWFWAQSRSFKSVGSRGSASWHQQQCRHHPLLKRAMHDERSALTDPQSHLGKADACGLHQGHVLCMHTVAKHLLQMQSVVLDGV